WWILALSLAALAAIAATPPNLAKAIEAQRRLTAERPSDAGAVRDRRHLLVLAHRTDEAEAAYRQAITLDPERASALFNLGLLEQQRGDLKGGVGLFGQGGEE